MSKVMHIFSQNVPNKDKIQITSKFIEDSLWQLMLLLQKLSPFMSGQ
jgi:hypothetical protein